MMAMMMMMLATVTGNLVVFVGTVTGNVVVAAIRIRQLSAIGQLSDISYQISAIRYQLSAISYLWWFRCILVLNCPCRLSLVTWYLLQVTSYKVTRLQVTSCC